MLVVHIRVQLLERGDENVKRVKKYYIILQGVPECSHQQYSLKSSVFLLR